MDDRVIAVVEPSKLALNVLHLLLFPRGFLLRGVQDIESLVPLVRNQPLAGMIADSRAFRKGLNKALDIFCDSKELIVLPKIFLCHSGTGEAKLRATLSKMALAQVILKPFHPDDLVEHVEAFFSS